MSSIACPFCAHTPTSCINSRPTTDPASGRSGGRVRRRYECPMCKSRFTTMENVQDGEFRGRRKGPIPFINFSAIKRELVATFERSLDKALADKEPPEFRRELLADIGHACGCIERADGTWAKLIDGCMVHHTAGGRDE